MNQTDLKKTMIVNPIADVPIYTQLANYFRLQIKSGALEENEKMIPEEEICQVLGISRSTVRQYEPAGKRGTACSLPWKGYLCLI